MVGRKVSGREEGTPSCLICSTSLTTARLLHPPIPAKQEARLFFLQFVADGAHHKYFKRVVSSPHLKNTHASRALGSSRESNKFTA